MEIPHTYEAAPAVGYGFITPNTTFRKIQTIPPAPPHIEPQHQVKPQNQVVQPSTHPTFEVKKPNQKRSWSEAENEALRAAVAKFGEKKWKLIAEHVPGRNNSQCIQRWRKALDPTLVKGCWAPAEDQHLINLLTENPTAPWAGIASRFPGRCSRQCRDRWSTALDPRVDRSSFRESEDAILRDLMERIGPQWSKIAGSQDISLAEHQRRYATDGASFSAGVEKKQQHLPAKKRTNNRVCH
jgi:hypothetical protein